MTSEALSHKLPTEYSINRHPGAVRYDLEWGPYFFSFAYLGYLEER